MSFEYGRNLRVTLFGQSHAAAIGCVIDGLPAGEKIDEEAIRAFMKRRAPGGDLATSRTEPDEALVVSGLVNGRTCGSPVCAVIENRDVRSGDYETIADTPRPSHADYTAHVKYRGFNDKRGGGHFSGRMTAPLCFAGAVCMQVLGRLGVEVGCHIARIGPVEDSLFDAVDVGAEQLARLRAMAFPVLDAGAGEKMKREIAAAAAEKDSVGGVIECCVLGLPAGVGEPVFDGLENRIASAVFAIPAVKGIEFGAGFAVAGMRGSEHNDPFIMEDGRVKTATNCHGGILGGISSGMPVIFRAAFKPTPSIGLEQRTVRLSDETQCAVTVKGRHDPCIAARAFAPVEAAAAIAVLDLINC